MQDFRELKVWARAHELTLAVYRATREFPREELFGLCSQMRRSAASIPANIAEGCCRSGDAEFARFAQIAAGSASELKYYAILAGDLHLVSSPLACRLTEQADEILRMLASLIKTLRRKQAKS